MSENQRLRAMEDDEEASKPAEARDYYTTTLRWPENEQPPNGIPFAATKLNPDYNLKEIVLTPPQIPREGDIVVLNDLIEADDEGNDEKELYNGKAVTVSPEIEEIIEDGRSNMVTQEPEIEGIVEDGKSKIVTPESRAEEDVYVAVGKDDLEVLKWALDHAVSPSSRIFLIHVSPPSTLIPTPVGNVPRSQLNEQQVTSYVNEEFNKRNNMMQKYIQLSKDAQVSAETLYLESNDTAKAILDLIFTRNIKNLVMGIRKPPNSWGKNKLSKGEIVKQNAPYFCEVALVYDANQQHKHHASPTFLCGICSGGINEVKD